MAFRTDLPFTCYFMDSSIFDASEVKIEQYKQDCVRLSCLFQRYLILVNIADVFLVKTVMLTKYLFF